MEKRSTHGGQGGLSYEAITAITICVAGFVMLMVLACAINMRRKKGAEGKIDATDLDPEQQVYMRDARNRNRDTLTGTKRFTMAAATNPPGRQPSSYMARSGMSDYGYDDVYTPGWESKPASRRQSGYADHSPESNYRYSPNPAEAEYFAQKVPHAQQQPLMAPTIEEPSEKPTAQPVVHEVQPTPSYVEDQQHHTGEKA